MNAPILDSLDRIIEETRQFQSLIDDEAWDELGEQLNARQEKLENTLSTTIVEEEKPQVIERLSLVANLDKKYQIAIKESRQRSTGNVLAFKRKHNAASAYSNVEKQ